MSVLINDAEIQELKQNAVTNFAVAVLAECTERAGYEEKPICDDEDGIVDYYIRLSDVQEAINKFIDICYWIIAIFRDISREFIFTVLKGKITFISNF